MIKLIRSYYSKFCSKAHINSITSNYIEMPKLVSNYNDKIITRLIKRNLPKSYFNDIDEDLKSFSLKMETEYFHLHRECEANQPRLEKFDSWGKCVDKLIICDAWKILKSISSKEGLISIPYENKFKEHSRLYQGAKLVLFFSLGGLYGCPLAMTDGAAFVIKGLGIPSSVEHAFHNLTSRHPKQFWTSGQWMTEKNGGSDVASSTETVALWDSDCKCHRLYGYKWFSSATDANMALTLARSVDLTGNVIQGGKGLSLYYLETISHNDGSINDWNHLQLVLLKDKLGTRQLPTAELILNGSKAIKLSEDGRGISSIAGMLTITRIYNAIGAVSSMRRVVLLATEYAKTRKCFGTNIIDKPLHASTLASLDIESRAGFYLVMDVMRLLGLHENQLATEEDIILLRTLSPLLKLYTAKQAISVISEGLECFGGQGYIESTGLPGIFRDAQVFPIWEGTTNILSLDVLRSLKIDTFNAAILHVFTNKCHDKLNKIQNKSYCPQIKQFQKALNTVESFVENNHLNLDLLQLYSRNLAYAMTRIYMGILLLEEASLVDADLSDHLSLLYWTKKDLVCELDQVNNEIKPDDWRKFFD